MAEFLLVAEGPSEFGSSWDDERTGFLRQLLPRVLEAEKSIRGATISVMSVKGIRKHGGGWTGKVLGAITSAFIDDKPAMFFVADRDRETQRPAEMREGRRKAREQGLVTPCALGCPVETIEAWILGDHQSLSGLLPGSNPPGVPEALDGRPGTERHPKVVFEGLLQDRTPANIFEDAGRCHDLERLKRTCGSFEAFVQDIHSEFNSSSGPASS